MKTIRFRDVAHRQMQFNLVEQQIRPWVVGELAFFDALLHLPRDVFLPADLKEFAFADCDIPLIQGSNKQVLVSVPAPKIEVKLVQALNIEPKQTVAVVGANAPFLVALLIKLGAKVDLFESNQAVLERMQAQLADLSNLKIHETSFIEHHQESGYREKFDALVFCAALETMIDSYLDVLKPGGRAVCVVGQLPAMTASLYTVVPAQKTIQKNALFDTCLPYISDTPRESGFYF